MKTHTVITSAILSALMLAVFACGGGSQPSPDVGATAEAMAKAMVEATAQAAPSATPVPPAPTATPVPPTSTPVPPTPVPASRLEYFGNTLYYLPSVTQLDAQRLLDYLIQAEFFDSESTKDIQLRKEGGVYEVRGGLKEGIDLNDTDLSGVSKAFACELGTYIFSGSAVHLIAVGVPFDDILKRYICLTASWGEQIDYGNNILYYLPSVTQQEAQKLFDFLVQYKIFDSENDIDLQLKEEGGVYEVRMEFREGIDLDDTDVSDLWKMMTCELGTYVFSGSAVHWIAVGVPFDDVIKRFMCFREKVVEVVVEVVKEVPVEKIVVVEVQVPGETVIVTKEVVVEKIVEVLVIVTATPTP